MELMQAVQEVAKQGSYINVAIPTAFASSALTIIGREIAAAIIGRRQRRNGGNAGSKPGHAPECRKHAEELIRIDTEQKNTKDDIKEMKADIKELLSRVPAKKE